MKLAMKKRTLINLIIVCVALIAVVVLSITLRNGDAAEGPYYATFMSLVPPIIAIGLALMTKEVYSSLFVGVIAAALFYADFNPIKAMDATVTEGIAEAVKGQAGIFAFLVILGAIVVLLNKAGGSRAFGKWAETHVKTRLGAIMATFVLGVLIFVDDYFNCLTVGSVMRPVSDTHKISRAKLAYIIDATAAPICMIAPVSSWAAAVSNSMSSEVAADQGKGLIYFIQAIPYNFYSILTIVFVIAITYMGFDYGKMAGVEFKALKGDIGVPNVDEDEGEEMDGAEEIVEQERSRVLDLVLPICTLIVSCILALLYVGGFFTEGDYRWDLIGAFGATDATVALPWGSLIALILIIVYLIARRLVTFKASMAALPKGFCAMVPAILILTLATALKNTSGLLGSDVFVKGLLENAETLTMFLPAIIFVIAALLAFATGTSWGTFGILIPIVQLGIGLHSELGIIAMSACLAGAVCGDHCSPISDTTIMASAGAQCNHVEHVSTQLPYAITVAAVSFVSYILAGLLHKVGWYLSLPIAIFLMLSTLVAIRYIIKRRDSKKEQGVSVEN